MRAIGIIPARYASSRLPGKPLAEIGGRPMIQRVYERAREARRLERVLVATDDRRILEAVWRFGGEAVMTSEAHRSGTDRLAEVAAGLEVDVVVNIQGDEPLIDPGLIDALIEPFDDRPIEMVTGATPITSEAESANPSVVKVVVDRTNHALYFSRLPIPYARGHSTVERLKHIGMYAYRRSFLLAYANMEPTPLELAESLEQLRAVENGVRIYVVRTDHDALSVDTLEDLQQVRALVEQLAA